MEEKKKKKPYNPFPDELEEGNTLVTEDDEESPPQREPLPGQDEGAREEAAVPVEPDLPDEDMEELGDDELERSIDSPAQPLQEEKNKPRNSQPRVLRSWTYPAAITVLVLLLADYSIVFLGKTLFWNVTTVYFGSFAARTALLLVAQYAFFSKRLTAGAAGWYSVFGWVGCVAGTIPAISRFVVSSSAWTFFNLIAEPVNMTVLALATTYVVITVRMPIHKPFNKPQSI